MQKVRVPMNAMTLSSIVDEVADWQLGGRHCCGRRVKLRGFLARRQGQAGSYAGLFAPVDDEITAGYRFITGERINSDVGARHILGEEALRALILLEPDAQYQRAAIERAAASMDRRLHANETQHGGGHRAVGTYCCNRCTVGLWRALAVDAYPHADRRLAAGMQWLKAKRDGGGAWRGMPFHYTLSALVEIDPALSGAELSHARPGIERRLSRGPATSDDPHQRRRRAILEKAMDLAERIAS